MPATADKELILAVHNIKDDRFREPMMALLHDYIVATDLSRGPDPDRSEHWTAKAVEYKLKLQKAMNPPKTKEGKPCEAT